MRPTGRWQVSCALLAAAALLIAVCFGPLTQTTRALELDLNLTPDEQLEPEESYEPLTTSTSAPRVEPPPTGGGGWLQSVKRATSRTIKSTLEKLPAYFDFESFSRKFKRRYSAAEALFRKSVFLGRCVEVFKARVSFRLGKVGYLQSVNKFSDRSPNEIKRMFMSGPPIEMRPKGQSEAEYYRKLEQTEAERAELDVELPSRAALYDDDHEDDDDNSIGESSDGHKLILHEAQARRELEELLSSSSGDRQLDEDLQFAVREELIGAGSESFSQAAAEGATSGLRKKPLPWPGRLRSSQLQHDPMEVDSDPAPMDIDSGSYEPEEERYVTPELDPEELDLDWSEHPCFHKIYDQGTKCGKCYVMAATTLAEFYKCSERENVVNKRQFSKDYVLDCGQKFAPTIMGCTGGSLIDTLRFIAAAGMHSIASWRQTRQLRIREMGGASAIQSPLDQRCPLDRFRTPLAQWGDIRVEMNPRRVHPNQWLEALEDGPLAASVQMPAAGLEGYAGGVHDGAGCATSGHWHSMVLVGYGVSERREPYWRFRNSWGDDWGDGGHFNLDMRVAGECLVGGVRLYREPLDI